MKTFAKNEKVKLEDADFENLVYIVEMKGVSALNPTEKLEMTNSDGVKSDFEFLTHHYPKHDENKPCTYIFFLFNSI